MVQAARSGKQNIIEGSEDGQTSSEMEIRLINVARGSLQELRADYLDYLNTHHLEVWPKDSERQKRMRDFSREQNDYEAYAPLVMKMTDEEYANLLLTLCHQTDKMMCAYLQALEERFVTEGGIKERMYAARTGYRQAQDEHMSKLEAENAALHTENAALKARIAELERRLGQGDRRS
jgi:four helix bundle suffix protein